MHSRLKTNGVDYFPEQWSNDHDSHSPEEEIRPAPKLDKEILRVSYSLKLASELLTLWTSWPILLEFLAKGYSL